MTPKSAKLAIGCAVCLSMGAILLVGAVLLIIAICLVQDWRGPYVWAETKAKWEARGVSFDPQKYYPPPVPDERNLAALPIFDLEPDPEPYADGMLAPMQLKHALDENLHGGTLPKINEGTDAIHAGVAAAYKSVFKGVVPPASPLAQFDTLYPVVGQLRDASATRPECRFKEDYSIEPPFARPFALLTEQIALAKKVVYHAKLALMENKPDVALSDIELNFRLAGGVERDPTLVAGLVAIGIMAINHGAIDDGLTRHAWNDAQLAELQRGLAKLDFLSGYESTMRGETVAGSMAMLDYTKSLHQQGKRPADDDEKVMDDDMGFNRWPDGWLDYNKAQIVDFEFRALAGVDPNKRRVHPEVLRNLDAELERVKAIPRRFFPWNLLFAVTMGPLTNAQTKFAEAQVLNDETMIACALERYRLAHGAYPAALDALAPQYIDAVPHDIMNGEPYHYRLNADGTFLLYSVGWNQTDEGGKVEYKQDNPRAIDYEHGDWVWPMVKR